MISVQTVSEIIAQYKKHGWNLRRVLLLPETKSAIESSLSEVFPGASVEAGEINAVWFSRSSRPGKTAWELRHLSENPFALIETFDDEINIADLEDALREIEQRLIERLGNQGLKK